MSNLKKGQDYESFVEVVYKAILEAEKRQGKIASVHVERNKIITSKSGTPAEIDIYWENEVAGIKHSVAIECKNYNKKIDVPRVRDFARKIEHISGLKGLMVTKKGFSENAIIEASSDNIDLLVVREQKEEDWDGYIKTVNLRIHAIQPSRTIAIYPKVNKEWAFQNGYKKGDEIEFGANNDRIVFEDKKTKFRHSLYALESNDFFQDKPVGQHTWEKSFDEGWMHADDQSFKLDFVQVKYLKPPNICTESNIDFEQYVLAVMEYINGDLGKFVVLKDGQKKQY